MNRKFVLTAGIVLMMGTVLLSGCSGRVVDNTEEILVEQDLDQSHEKNFLDDDVLKVFLEDIKKDIENSDLDSLSNKVHYPVIMSDGISEISIEDERALKEIFSSVLDGKLSFVSLDSALTELSFLDDGVLIGNEMNNLKINKIEEEYKVTSITSDQFNAQHQLKLMDYDMISLSNKYDTYDEEKEKSVSHFDFTGTISSEIVLGGLNQLFEKFEVQLVSIESKDDVIANKELTYDFEMYKENELVQEVFFYDLDTVFIYRNGCLYQVIGDNEEAVLEIITLLKPVNFD